MKTAYSYVRFSSEAQSKGDSVRRQVELAEAYAREHGLELDTHSYRDLGISAFRGRNGREGALAGFLQAVDEGIVPWNTTLLVEALDRISRANASEAIPLFMSIIRRGVTLVTLSDGEVYTKESIDSERGTMLLIGSIMKLAGAHDESLKKSKRVKAAFAANRQAKKVTKQCPSWLVPNADMTGYDLVHEKVAVIRKIFEMAAGGRGIYLICKHLNLTGVPPIGNLKRGWTVDAVGKILKHPAVVGRLVSLANDETIEDFYPSIIDKAVYFDVREQIADRNTRGKGRKGDGVANLFSGLNRCECGSPMRLLRIPSGSHGLPNTYLECVSSLEKTGCDAKRVNYDMLELQLLRYFLEVRAVDVQQKVHDPRPELRALLHEKRVQIERLLDNMEQLGSAQSKGLAGRLQKREQEIVDLELQLRAADVPTIDANVWREASRLFEQVITAEGDERVELRGRVQAVLKRVVERITLPKMVVKRDGERWRQAVITWRGDWDQRLKTRDDESRSKQYGVFSDPEDKGVLWYPQPQMGGKWETRKSEDRYRAAA